MLTHSAIAVFAAALGCVVTLYTVGAFGESAKEGLPEEIVAVELTQPAVVVAPLDSSDPESNLQQFQSELTEGAAERSQMAETLIQLTRGLADVQAQVLQLEQANTERLALASQDQNNRVRGNSQTGDSEPRGFNRRNQRQTNQERLQSLVAAGLDEQTALDIQARRDEHQLARLELFDQAAREGWSESDQLQERLSELNADRVDLREELGDDAYDRYLYESGDANRVSIASIISGSAAEIAGLEVGDSIISYDNRRVFRVRELQQATREGTKGEYVLVFFDRGGQSLTTDLPRGPLGVTLETSSVTP